jgi:hypothetical protein
MTTTRRLLAAAAASGLLFSLAPVTPASADRKPLPENNAQAKPNDDEGYFLGYPSPTYSWHGCHKTSSVVTPAPQEVEVPDQPTRGNAQAKVTWTTTASTTATSRYTVSWKVADGWKICGVEAAILGDAPDNPYLTVMQVGYTSKATKGSTAASGSETIKVHLSKKDCQEIGIDTQYAGNFSISKIYSLTAYVKKAKR